MTKYFKDQKGWRENKDMNNKSYNKFITIAVILIVSMAFSGCNLFHKPQALQPRNKQIVLDEQQEENANIKVEPIKTKVIEVKITIPAQFKAINKFLDRTYAPIDGKVVNVYVEPGTIVKVGQPLVEIKSDAIGQIQLEFLDAYIDINSMIKQAAADYNVSSKAYKRESILFHEGISARSTYEMAYAQMLKDKASLDAAKTKRNATIQVYAQRVALYGGNAGTIMRAASTQKIYPYITLTSNKNGIVLDRKVNPGEIVEKNKELFNIADLNTIWLVGYAFEKDAPFLKVGQKVTGILEETHGKNVSGQLSYVASILDVESKTLEVRADIPNKDLTIKPNMYAEMEVDVGEVNALAVPNTALQKYGDFTFAYVQVAPHTYEERKIQLGQRNAQFTEVKSGLKEGEEVVTNGGFSLLGESIKRQEEE